MYLVLCRVNGVLELRRLPDAKIVFSCSGMTEGHRLLHSSSAALPAPAAAAADQAPQDTDQITADNLNLQRDLAEHTGATTPCIVVDVIGPVLIAIVQSRGVNGHLSAITCCQYRHHVGDEVYLHKDMFPITMMQEAISSISNTSCSGFC